MPGHFATLFADNPDISEYNIKEQLFPGLEVTASEIFVIIQWIYDEQEIFEVQPLRMLKLFVLAYQKLKLPRGFLIWVERGMFPSESTVGVYVVEAGLGQSAIPLFFFLTHVLQL